MAFYMTVYREPGMGKDGMFVASSVELCGEIVHCHEVADGDLSENRPPPTEYRGRSIDRMDVQKLFEPMAQSDHLNVSIHAGCQPRLPEDAVV